MLVVLANAFLLTRASEPVWQLLTPLQRIQFPWRLATLITVALTALAAHGAASLKPRMAPGRRSLVLAAVCIVALWLMVTARNGLEILRQTPNAELNPHAQDAWEYKPRGVQGEDFQRAVRQSKGPDGRIPKAALDAGGRVEVVRWRPRDIRLHVEAPRDSVLFDAAMLGTPTLVISAGGPDARARAESLGVDVYLQKPVQFVDIISTVRTPLKLKG